MVKRKLANASLGRLQNNQILTAKDAFLYCRENITGITFFCAHAHEVQTGEMISKAGLKKEALYHEPEAFFGFHLNLLAQSATKEYQTILFSLELIIF